MPCSIRRPSTFASLPRSCSPVLPADGDQDLAHARDAAYPIDDARFIDLAEQSLAPGPEGGAGSRRCSRALKPSRLSKRCRNSK